MSKDYLQTPAWQADRKACFALHGYRCLVRRCKRTDITCDHIYARKRYRWLQRVRRFHQPLCDYHNKKKGQAIIDYRPLRYRIFRPVWFYYYMVIRWFRRSLYLLAIGFVGYALANNQTASEAFALLFSTLQTLSESLQSLSDLGAFFEYL